MRYIGRDQKHVYLKCSRCKKISRYNREKFEKRRQKKPQKKPQEEQHCQKPDQNQQVQSKTGKQKTYRKCANCNAEYRIIWGYPYKFSRLLNGMPLLIMTGLCILVIFIICFPLFQRNYLFNKAITALDPLLASVLIPALCSIITVISNIVVSRIQKK